MATGSCGIVNSPSERKERESGAPRALSRPEGTAQGLLVQGLEVTAKDEELIAFL